MEVRRMSAPELTRCETCGDWRGEVVEYEDEGPLSVSCWCEAIPCRVCDNRPARRPISNYYDEASSQVWHVPHFGGVCDECKAARRKSRRPMT